MRRSLALSLFVLAAMFSLGVSSRRRPAVPASPAVDRRVGEP